MTHGSKVYEQVLKLEKNMKTIKLLFLVTFLIFCVSGMVSAGENRFFVQNDQKVLIDKETGLMWPLQDNGSDISWHEGKEYCESFSLGGFSDWRMPSQEELASLYDLKAAESSEYYIILSIRISACCQWAIDNRKEKVGSFDFEYGNRDWGYPMSTVDARVLPVRNVK
jgi:uncharacterized protein DUF1566